MKRPKSKEVRKEQQGSKEQMDECVSSYAPKQAPPEVLPTCHTQVGLTSDLPVLSHPSPLSESRVALARQGPSQSLVTRAVPRSQIVRARPRLPHEGQGIREDNLQT